MKKTFSRHFVDAFKAIVADKDGRTMFLLAFFGPLAAGLTLLIIAFATDSPVKPLKPLVTIWLLGMTGMLMFLCAEAAARMHDQCE